MIIKIKEADRARIGVGELWVYYDGIQRVRTFGFATANDSHRMSITGDELRRWVDESWGTEREFAEELWPDFDDDAQLIVRCVHAVRDDGRMLLLLIEGEAYLLSNDGKTVDRL